MRHALLASLFLALAGCAGEQTTVIRDPVGTTYGQKTMGAPTVPLNKCGTVATSLGSKDMGATPAYTLADIR